jgi:rhodanese-related sulfurtransferase
MIKPAACDCETGATAPQSASKTEKKNNRFMWSWTAAARDYSKKLCGQDQRRGIANPPRCGTLNAMKMSLSFTLLAGIACVIALAVSLRPARAGQDEKKPPANVTHADAKEAAKLVAKSEVVVLDVRTPGEYSAGHITGATNIDFLAGDFSERLAKLDREKSYLVHCASGGRSTRALPQLSKLGFKHVVHLDGGFKAWQAAGNPVEKRQSPAGP